MVSSTSVTTTSALPNPKPGNAQGAITTQLAAKQTALEAAKTDDEKAKINAEIATLKAKLEAMQTRDKQDKPQETTTQDTEKSLIGTKNFEDGAGFGNRKMWV